MTDESMAESTTRKKATAANAKCPCGSDKAYEDCCGPLHAGEAQAETPEALMRSRYAAFIKKDYEYLEETVDPQTNSDFDHAGNRAWGESVELYKLEILRAEQNANKGLVEFKAYFRQDGANHVHHEISKFRKQAGTWYFREGKVHRT
jgi:SEC-C motif-containing protein